VAVECRSMKHETVKTFLQIWYVCYSLIALLFMLGLLFGWLATH